LRRIVTATAAGTAVAGLGVLGVRSVSTVVPGLAAVLRVSRRGVVHLLLRVLDPLLLRIHLLVLGGAVGTALLGSLRECRAGGVVAVVGGIHVVSLAEGVTLPLLDEGEVHPHRALVARRRRGQGGRERGFGLVEPT